MKKEYIITLTTLKKYVVRVEAHSDDDAIEEAISAWGDDPGRYEYSETEPDVLSIE